MYTIPIVLTSIFGSQVYNHNSPYLYVGLHSIHCQWSLPLCLAQKYSIPKVLTSVLAQTYTITMVLTLMFEPTVYNPNDPYFIFGSQAYNPNVYYLCHAYILL